MVTEENLTREQFASLQKHLELLGQEIAMGRESASTDTTIADIEMRMDKSDWVIDPDLGVVPKNNLKGKA